MNQHMLSLYAILSIIGFVTNSNFSIRPIFLSSRRPTITHCHRAVSSLPLFRAHKRSGHLPSQKQRSCIKVYIFFFFIRSQLLATFLFSFFVKVALFLLRFLLPPVIIVSAEPLFLIRLIYELFHSLTPAG